MNSPSSHSALGPGWRNRTAPEIVSAFCRRFAAELADRRARGLETGFLLRYYAKLFDPHGRPSALAVRGYAERLEPAVEILRRLPAGARLIDAGCGFGTESLLFASLGADVRGVELRADLADRARSRIDFHRRAAGDLRLEFITAHILRWLPTAEPADLIWALESVSHIYPPQDFLVRARERLRPGGFLILADPNILNPYAWLSGIRIRGSIRHAPKRVFTDPWSGALVDYGQEYRFSAAGMARRLRAAGLAVRSIRISGYLGSTLWPPRLAARPGFVRAMTAFEILARRTPGLSRLGANYTIVAQRVR